MIKQRQKKAVSIRLAASDVEQVKTISARLGARDSDVVRYALKLMLTRLAPIADPQSRGRALVPVFVEAGFDLIRHFDLDSTRLEALLNEGAEQAQRVARDDVALLTMSSSHPSLVSLRLARRSGEGSLRADVLRNYLYDKYVYEPRETREVPAVERADPLLAAG